jgi:drug/metabolite transporter (DMT)-like permease
MIATIAQTLTLFCTLVVVLAAATWVLTLRRHTPRQIAHRIAVTFGVFAVAAGYVWLDLGPDLDARLAAHDRAPLADPERPPQDVRSARAEPPTRWRPLQAV